MIALTTDRSLQCMLDNPSKYKLNFCKDECKYYEMDRCPGYRNGIEFYDGKWLDYDYRYDSYDPDWYCPVGAPASQKLWCDYILWAAPSFDYIVSKSIYTMKYNEKLTDAIPYVERK